MDYFAVKSDGTESQISSFAIAIALANGGVQESEFGKLTVENGHYVAFFDGKEELGIYFSKVWAIFAFCWGTDAPQNVGTYTSEKKALLAASQISTVSHIAQVWV